MTYSPARFMRRGCAGIVGMATLASRMPGTTEMQRGCLAESGRTRVACDRASWPGLLAAATSAWILGRCSSDGVDAWWESGRAWITFDRAGWPGLLGLELMLHAW